MSYIEKKAVIKKLHDFHRKVKQNDGKIGVSPRIIDLSYDNACNFKCEHCFTRAPEGINTTEHITLDRIGTLADEADALGFYEFDLQGGELLINPELFFQIVEKIKPERFYVYLTTNGYLVDEPMAQRLANAGIDRVSVSIDSMDPKEHDSFRGIDGAHAHATQALEFVKQAGMDPFMNITIGHYNAFSPEIEDLMKYSLDHGYKTILNAAVPAGCWQGNTEAMLTETDTKHIEDLRKKYGNVVRDLWNPFDRKQEEILGCNAGNILYITPWGDVLSCPFIHIKLGNIKEQNLKEIVDYTFTIKHFAEYTDRCLAGENKEFVTKYMSGEMSTQYPVDAKKVFQEDDYIKE